MTWVIMPRLESVSYHRHSPASFIKATDPTMPTLTMRRAGTASVGFMANIMVDDI